MPTRYNQGYGGQRGGGGYSPYGYQFPAQQAQQQESFFQPLPLDFVQQQFDRRQNEYDLSYTAVLDNQDKLSQQMVGMRDLASKQELINKNIDEVNEVVRTKHGGDWGAANKDVASMIVKARGNPFWNVAKYAETQRERIRELEMKYGANTMIFNDPRKNSVLDENGQIRPPEAFEPDVIEKSDWLDTGRQIMQGLAGDLLEAGEITQDEYELLRVNQLELLDPTKIRRLSQIPEVRDLFISESPDFQRLFAEGDDAMKQRFGVAGKDINTAAEDILAGVGLARQFSKTKTSFMPNAEIKRQRAAEEDNKPFKTWTLPGEVVPNAYPGAVQQRKMKFSPTTGGIMSAEERMQQKQDPSMLSMMPVFRPGMPGMSGVDLPALFAKEYELIKEGLRKLSTGVSAHPMQIALYGISQVAKNKKEFFAMAAEEADKRYYDMTVKNNPELSGYTPERAIAIKSSADEHMMQQSGAVKRFSTERGVTDNLHKIVFGDGDKNGDLFRRQLYLDGQPIAGDKKEKLLAKELGYDPDSEAFKEVLKNANATGTTYAGSMPGALVASVQDSDGKTHTLELSNFGEVGKLATPSWTIVEWIRSNGQSERLSNYSNVQDDGAGGAYVDSGHKRFMEDGTEVPLWYHIDSKIVAQGDSDVGRHDVDIDVVYFLGTQDELRDPYPYTDEEGTPVKRSLTGILNDDEQAANAEFYSLLRGTPGQE